MIKLTSSYTNSFNWTDVGIVKVHFNKIVNAQGQIFRISAIRYAEGL